MILKTYVGVLYSALLLAIGVVTWTSFRGLDITDESYYLVGYLQGIEHAYGLTYFHKIYNTFFGFFGLGIVEIRLLRIVLSLLASLAFAHSLLKFLRKLDLITNEKLDIHFLFISLTVGSLLGYTWLPQTLSYNIMSALFLQLIVTCYLYGETTWNRTINSAFKILAGVFIGASFYNKFPNLITSLTMLVVFSAFIRTDLNFKQRIISIIYDVLLYAIGLVIISLILFKSDLLTEVHNYLVLIFSSSDQITSTDYLEIYTKDFERLLTRMMPYIVITAVYGMSSFFIFKRTKSEVLKRTVEFFAILLMLIFIVINESYMGGISRKYFHFDFYLISTILFVIALFNHRSELGEKFYKVLFICIFLFSFLSGSLGTNNPLSMQFMIYMVFLIATVLIVTIVLRKGYLYFLSVLIVCTSVSQIATGMILDPYRESHGILSQKFEVKDLKGFENLKLDSAAYDLKVQLSGVRKLKAKHIFVFSHQTGIALLTEKTPYGFGWCSPSNPSFCSKLIENAENVEEEDLIFIIPQKIEIHSDIKNELKAKGINFPDNYVLFNQIIFENCKKGKNVKLNIYVHNK